MSTSRGCKSEPRDSLEVALPISNEQAQQDQAQPLPSFPSQSQPDPKPSPPPAPTASSSKPIWPETYLLFLDPLSTIAIPRILQHLSKLTDGNPPRLTTVLLEASHIVIDPSSMFGDAVLEQQAQSQIQKPSDFKPQLVVTDRWLRECILWSNWEEEAEYLFTGSKKEEVKVKKEEGGTGKGKGKGREGVKREKEDVEDEDDGELPTRGRWLESEHDALARFLLPLHDYTLRDENGRDAFEAFAETEQTRRSANACREHYRSWEDTYKARLVELRGGTGLGKTRGETEGKGKGKGRAARESSSSESDLDLDSDSDSDDEDAKEPVRQRGLGRGNGIRIWYTDQEESDLKECLRTSSTPTEAFKKMSDLHPRRTFNSIRKRYHNRKDQYESLLAPGSRSGTYHWTTSEELDLVRLLSKPHASVTEVCRAFHAQHPSRSTESARTRYNENKQRFQQAVKELEDRSSESESRSTPSSPPSTSTSQTTFKQPKSTSSGSKRSFNELDQPFASSSSSSSKQPRLDRSPRPDAFRFASNSNLHQSNQQQHHPSPPPPQKQDPSPFHPDSDPHSDSEFEPPSFLQLGVAPSAVASSSSSPFCHWCGTEEDEAAYFEMLVLAEQDPSAPEGFRKVEGREACSFCVERTEKWIAQEGGSGKEMAELERLDWLRKKLEYVGRRERATLVRRSDGGRAEEK